MSAESHGGESRVLQVLQEMSAAQVEHGRALEALRHEFRALNQNATYAAGNRNAGPARSRKRHDAHRANRFYVLRQLEQRLSVVERKVAK